MKGKRKKERRIERHIQSKKHKSYPIIEMGTIVCMLYLNNLGEKA